ncbi:MAG TPA: UDP-N-acetylglucosamine 2-epimerase (non-hydrolyzing) [Burkholderiaceae bacterium]|nr:UDP-N-acetylglucosamine 2-epimerase (non-hydrolyzing) [Burkholderiaceae bacterium]
MRVLQVVGARPQFVKLAPVSRALAAAAREGGMPCEELVLHTGQHYDDDMSAHFFEELDLPRPAVNLGAGSGSHGEQTGRMLAGIERVLLELQPDVVVVYSDTNSTLAGALAAVKVGTPVAHVEAGLRSGNRRMPEEINRIATDHVCDLLFAPTEAAVANLRREGLATRTQWVGDVMADAVLHGVIAARELGHALDRFAVRGRRFALATLHRAASTTTQALPKLLDTLEQAAGRFDAMIVPLHPRTRAAIARHRGHWRPDPRVVTCEPLGHRDLLQLLDAAAMVLTDSGGLQKEAFLLGTPCVTLRGETEWVESVDAGGNRLAGIEAAAVLAAVDGLMSAAPPKQVLADRAAACYGFGKAAARIAAALPGAMLPGADRRGAP